MVGNGLNLSNLRLILFFFLSLLFTFACRHNFFFWDTITQVSVPANWYYDNNFRYFFVPNGSATDHPTITGLYLGLIWKIAGRSLAVSHFAFLPFIYGIFVQLFRLIGKSGEKNLFLWLIFVLAVCDPTLVSQMSLPAFDVIQIFAFLWSINCILEQKKVQLGISFSILCLTSLRGIICGGGVILYSLIINYFQSNKITFRELIPFIPGIIMPVIFYLLFYMSRHSFIQDPVTDKWNQFLEFVSPAEMIRNTGIFAWRLIDFGRVGIWIVFAFFVLRVLWHRIPVDNFMRNTLLVALTQFLVFFPACILYKNPFGHRYLLPLILPVAVLTSYLVLKYVKKRWLVYAAMLTVLLGGWFWVYPETISQGWDSTPAHWPYYSVRREMIRYIDSENIPPDSVGSFFPNTASFMLTDLTGRTGSFREADLVTDKYILSSNVFNLKDQVIDDLSERNKWTMVKTISRRNVRMSLFRRNPQSGEP